MPRNQRSTSQSSDAFVGIPAEMKAFRDGWIESTLSEWAFSGMLEDDFGDLPKFFAHGQSNSLRLAVEEQAVSDESIL